MTLEEAIRSNEDLELSYRDRMHRLPSEEAKKVCLQIATNYHQQAEWLRELKEKRELPEIIRCGECAHSNKEYSGEMWCGICNGFGIDENSFCSFAEKRYVENG